jgi:hypothetical protein
VLGEKVLNSFILSQRTKQLVCGVELSFEPAHLGERQIQLRARRNFVRRSFEVVARKIRRQTVQSGWRLRDNPHVRRDCKHEKRKASAPPHASPLLQ